MCGMDVGAGCSELELPREVVVGLNTGVRVRHWHGLKLSEMGDW